MRRTRPHRLSLPLTSLLLVLVAGCVPRLSIDSGAVDGGGDLPDGTDTGSPDAPLRIDSGSDAPGSDVGSGSYCGRVIECLPSSTLESCLTLLEDGLERAGSLGCRKELERTNACMLEALRVSCTLTDPLTCDAPITEYNQCVVAATGRPSFSCDLTGGLPRCLTYRGFGADPDSTCGALGGTVLAACPVDGELGRCTQRFVGGVTLVTAYYLGTSEATLAGARSACGDGWEAP
jgi:hypothetical protein